MKIAKILVFMFLIGSLIVPSAKAGFQTWDFEEYVTEHFPEFTNDEVTFMKYCELIDQIFRAFQVNVTFNKS